jgi:uncharacterized protein YaaW (UPF0174 family)
MPEFVRDPIFQILPAESLIEIAKCLSYRPRTSEKPSRFVHSLPHEEQLSWFDAHRNDLEDEVCRLGSWSGEVLSYSAIVRKIAKKLKARHPLAASTHIVERAIVAKLWNEAVAKLSPDEVKKLKVKAVEVAQQHGKSLTGEMAGFAAISAAQLSGFGVYLLGSTLLGALNGALGLGLSFGAFTGLSSMISTAIGPIGWAFLGFAALFKMAAPNYKKVIPVVILIAVSRPMTAPVPIWRRPPAIVALIAILFTILLVSAYFRTRPNAHGPVEETQKETARPTRPIQVLTDDQVAIEAAIAREGYRPDGKIVDVSGLAGGSTLHVLRVKCESQSAGCEKLFVFSGSTAVWSEGIDPSPFNYPIATQGPGKFSIGMMEHSEDGAISASIAFYTWNGHSLVRESQQDEAWMCGNHECNDQTDSATTGDEAHLGGSANALSNDDRPIASPSAAISMPSRPVALRDTAPSGTFSTPAQSRNTPPGWSEAMRTAREYHAQGETSAELSNLMKAYAIAHNVDRDAAESIYSATVLGDFYEHDVMHRSLSGAYYLEALGIAAGHYGTNSLEWARSAFRLARINNETQKFGEAMKLNLAVRAIQERVLGPDSPELALTLNNLAIDYMNYNWRVSALERYPDYDKARTCLTRALKILSAKVGSDDATFRTVKRNLELLPQSR